MCELWHNTDLVGVKTITPKSQVRQSLNQKAIQFDRKFQKKEDNDTHYINIYCL